MQFAESIRLALQTIWGNKLRSLMTVLGNIVAVSSIVTVVSLIQGMNAMVSNAIVTEASADAFTIQRLGIIRSDDERERMQRNPSVTLDEADAVRHFSPTIGSVMAQAQQRGKVTYHEQVLDSVEIQGVTSDYLNFAAFNAERGRMMSAIEVERNRPVVLLGTDVASSLFGEVNPIDKVIQIQGVHFRIFGARQSLSLLVKPATPVLLPIAMDDATVALRVTRHLNPRDLDNFGIFTS